MNNRNVRNLCFTILLLFLAKGVTADDSLQLRKIMNDLGKNMQIITDGISREEWGLVEKTALLVADHPQPPLSEKMRILNFVGTSMAKFKAHDGETHEQALALREAARAKDGAGVIFAFQKLQLGCFNCHNEFRKPFVAYFYGSKTLEQ